MTASRSDGVLLVPIANPETVDRLFDTAIDIAAEQALSIVAFHVVTVPPQLPLSAGEEVIGDDEADLLEYIRKRAEAVDVDIKTTVRYGRDTATAIVGSVDHFGGEAMLLGWHGRPRRRDIVFGSFIDRVLGNAPCDVYIKRIKRQPGPLDSILIPVAGGPHDELATQLGATLASRHGASITLMHVESPGGEESAHEGYVELFRNRRAHIPAEIAVDELVVEHDHVAGAITDETGNHDLVVLGATEDPFLRRKLVGSVAQGVGRTATSSVIVTRRHLPG